MPDHRASRSGRNAGSPLKEDPDLDTLFVLFGMSVRAFHVCEAAGMLKLSDIRDHAARNGGFKNLRNCGKLTRLELEGILVRLDAKKDQEALPDQLVPAETRSERTSVPRKFSSHFLNLSTRARNVLHQHADSEEPEAVFNFLMGKDGDMPKLPGAGTKVMHELRTMREDLLHASKVKEEISVQDLSGPEEDQLRARSRSLPLVYAAALKQDPTGTPPCCSSWTSICWGYGIRGARSYTCPTSATPDRGSGWRTLGSSSV